MRALLRVSIEDCSYEFADGKSIQNTHASKEFADEYKKFIENLFLDIGFTPLPIAIEWYKEEYNDIEKKFQDVLSKTNHGGYTSEVLEVFKQVPSEIRSRELCKLFFLGSISEGQASILITAINATELHIRVHSSLFRRIQLACEDVKSKIEEHAKKNKKTTHLKIKPKITVMEHKKDVPTIEGNILEHPFKDAFRLNKVSSKLFFSGLVFSGIIMIFSALKFYGIIPYTLPHHSFVTKLFHILSVDRLFPPIVIFLTTSGVPIFISWRKFAKHYPIIWDNLNSNETP